MLLYVITVGQGAKISGLVGFGTRYFVLSKSSTNGDVYVVKSRLHPKLFSKGVWYVCIEDLYDIFP
jgi:hypothetical protein